MADLYSLIIRADTSDIRRGRQDLDRFGNRARRTDTTVNRLGRSFGGLSSASGILRNALAGVVASLGVREIIQYSDSWKSVENQLKQVTGSTAELQAIQTKLVSVANETRSSFAATGNLYARLARSTTDLNLTSSDLVDLTTTINQSFAASGATATEAAAAITQLSQGFAAGALRGDEFNSVSEQAPAIMRAIADSLNMTIGELREFAAQGGITAEIVVTALSGAADKIASDFSKMSVTLNQSLTVAQNNLTQFIGESESLSTAVESAGDSIVKLSENIETATDVVAALAIVVAGRLTGSLAASGGALAFNAVQAVRVQIALGRMAGVSTTAAAGMVAMGGAARAASASMALLGGPVGVALIAAGSLYYFRDALFATRVELGEAGREVRGFTEGLEDMTATQVENSRSSLAEQMRENKIAIAEAGVELDRLKEKQKESPMTLKGVPSSATIDVSRAENEIARLTKLGGVIQEELQKVEARSESLSKSASAAAAATANAATRAAEATAKSTAAIQLELKFLRAHNALIEAGVSATEADVAIRETKQELQLEGKGLTAAEAAEYVALGNAIDDATEAEKRRQAALMASTKIGVEDDPMLLKLDAQKRGQALILEEQEIWQAKMAENEQMIQDQTLSTLANSIGAMKGFFESGTAEYAAFVLAQKGVMAMQAIMAANLAATMALTTIIPGDPTSPLRAAAQAETLRTIGYINAGLILASGAAEVAGARAMGGSVTGGNSYMVGENGPEVVTMGGSGVVTPSSVGGGGMSVVINDQTTTSTGHDVQTQETTGPEGQRQMQVTIRDTVRRQVMQGEFDRQLGSKFDLKSKGRRV